MGQLTQYKCPNCGATIPFEPGSQKLKCAHCSTEYDIETLDSLAAEQTINDDSYGWDEYREERLEKTGEVTYVCPSCGGEVVGDEAMSACQCPYCGNSVIVAKQFEGMLKPDLIIPFAYDKKQAQEAYRNYLKGKTLLAKDFAAENVIEKLNGLYVPYWLFDADASCQARFHATRSHHHTSNDEEITETDHYMIYRDGRISFESVPVDATTKLTPELMESLEPFDYAKAVSFNAAYLSGFFADRYDEDADTAIERANERIKNSTIDAISSSIIGYDSVLLDRANVCFSNGKISYALLPIYVFSTKYKGKVYTFAMNGQTGKFSGNLPADTGKTWGSMGLIFLGIFVLMFLLMYFLVL